MSVTKERGERNGPTNFVNKTKDIFLAKFDFFFFDDRTTKTIRIARKLISILSVGSLVLTDAA